MFKTHPLQFVTGREVDTAPRLLTIYFRSYTGSRFESYIDAENPDEITPRDLLAVTTLSVHVPSPAAIWLLEDGKEEVRRLLRDIGPVDLTIWDERADLSRASPASELWGYVRGHRWPQGEAKSGLGRTKASKLLAAKRPHLFPIYDRHVAAALFSDPRTDFWSSLQDLFRSSPELRDALGQAIHRADGMPPNLSLLRSLDVIVWMRVHGHKWSSDLADLPPLTPP